MRETAVTFMGGWGSADPNPMDGWDLPAECFCTMQAEQLCAAANDQGLLASFERGLGTHVLTISWPDPSD